jgi:hypothetical protein
LPGVPTGSTAGERFLGEEGAAFGDDFFGLGFGDCFFGDFFGETFTDGEPGDSGGSSASSTGEQMDLLRFSDELELLRCRPVSGVCFGELLFPSRSANGVLTAPGAFFWICTVISSSSPSTAQ